MLLCALTARPAWSVPQAAGEGSTSNPDPPDAVITFPGDARIQSVDLLPDGERALVVLRVGSVNLWAVLVYYWIELLAAALTATCVVLLWRLLRHRRQIGKPHCRHCNYLLVDFEGEVCPECGRALSPRNRVIGRPWRWRVAVVGTVLVGAIGSYLYLFPQVPRVGGAANWQRWLSPRAYDWAWHHNQAWLHRRKAWLTRVVVVELATGRIVLSGPWSTSATDMYGG